MYVLVTPPRLGASQIVALGAASVASTAVGLQTYAVRISSTGACHIAIGGAPVAVAANTLIAAGQVGEVFGIAPGQKVAVIQDGSATGNCSITELTH